MPLSTATALLPQSCGTFDLISLPAGATVTKPASVELRETDEVASAVSSDFEHAVEDLAMEVAEEPAFKIPGT